MPMDDSPNGAGLSARHLTRALDASLRRLGLDSVDLYQVHAYDPLTPLEETLRTLDAFVRAGKIRYWGLSNFTGWQLTKAVHLARALDVAGPVTLQPQYSLLVREIEWEIVAGRDRRRHGPAAVEPARRRLAVRQVPPRPAPVRRDPARRGPGPRHGGLGPPRHRPHLARRRRGAEGGRRPRRIDGRGRARLGHRPAGVTSTILGARTVDQLETNLRAADLRLTVADTARARRRERPARHRLSVRRAGRRAACPHPPGRPRAPSPSPGRRPGRPAGRRAGLGEHAAQRTVSAGSGC